ncbi:hypothetical protein EMMF5_005437 [Cystobasidiomycetes sp. EMM_F5]
MHAQNCSNAAADSLLSDLLTATSSSSSSSSSSSTRSTSSTTTSTTTSSTTTSTSTSSTSLSSSTTRPTSALTAPTTLMTVAAPPLVGPIDSSSSPSSNKNSSTGLSKGTVIGLSVAGAIVLVFALLCVYMTRRRLAGRNSAAKQWLRRSGAGDAGEYVDTRSGSQEELQKKGMSEANGVEAKAPPNGVETMTPPRVPTEPNREMRMMMQREYTQPHSYSHATYPAMGNLRYGNAAYPTMGSVGRGDPYTFDAAGTAPLGTNGWRPDSTVSANNVAGVGMSEWRPVSIVSANNVAGVGTRFSSQPPLPASSRASTTPHASLGYPRHQTGGNGLDNAQYPIDPFADTRGSVEVGSPVDPFTLAQMQMGTTPHHVGHARGSGTVAGQNGQSPFLSPKMINKGIPSSVHRGLEYEEGTALGHARAEITTPAVVSGSTSGLTTYPDGSFSDYTSVPITGDSSFSRQQDQSSSPVHASGPSSPAVAPPTRGASLTLSALSLPGDTSTPTGSIFPLSPDAYKTSSQISPLPTHASSPTSPRSTNGLKKLHLPDKVRSNSVSSNVSQSPILSSAFDNSMHLAPFLEESEHFPTTARNSNVYPSTPEKDKRMSVMRQQRETRALSPRSVPLPLSVHGSISSIKEVKDGNRNGVETTRQGLGLSRSDSTATLGLPYLRDPEMVKTVPRMPGL